MVNPVLQTQHPKIPCFDLTRQYALLQEELRAGFEKVAQSGRYILGPALEQFEQEFASYCGSRFGIGVGSGTDALILALKALRIQKGDEVLVPSFTFVATVFAVMHVGATPVFVDVDPLTYTLDVRSAEKQVTRQTKAILPVHLYGQTAEMDSLLSLAKEAKLKVVEDAAQAHGATWKGKKTGSFGDAGCFSFYPTKNLGACGDGGIVVTSDEAFAERIRILRNTGRKTTQAPHTEMGWTSRLDTCQAMWLGIKLKHLDTFNEKRRRLAERYRMHLNSTPLGLPTEAAHRKHVYHLFVVRVPHQKRSALQQKLLHDGIGTMIHYTAPVHRQPFYAGYSKQNWNLPVTDQISEEILTLPMFPELKDEEQDYVCQSIRRFYEGC